MTTLHADYPGNVTAEFEVAYASAPGYRPLTLDIYQAKGASSARKPALIWLHGGGWLAGSSRMSYGVIGTLDQVMAKAAARGYVAFSINYRLSSEAKFPAQIEDGKAAIRWVRANADKYHVDPQRIAIGGDSAGGYLAALAGTSCGETALEGALGNQDQSSCVQAVVDWYGVVSFKNLLAQGKASTDSPESKLLGCEVAKCSAELLKQADPLTYISTNTPPFLIMHGQADTVVPVQQSQELDDALKAKGVTSQLVLLPGLNHVFIGLKAEQAPGLLDTVFKFLDSTVGMKK
jgi:acetyl esterase/lipase